MKRILFVVLSLCVLSSESHAGFFTLSDYHNYGPLATRSQNPLYLLFLAETPERGVLPLKKKEWGISLETTFSNVFERNLQATGVGEDIDLELWRTAFKGSYGVTNAYTVGIEIPFLSFSGGFLDGYF